jgi:hypothetical protein
MTCKSYRLAQVDCDCTSSWILYCWNIDRRLNMCLEASATRRFPLYDVDVEIRFRVSIVGDFMLQSSWSIKFTAQLDSNSSCSRAKFKTTNESSPEENTKDGGQGEILPPRKIKRTGDREKSYPRGKWKGRGTGRNPTPEENKKDGGEGEILPLCNFWI